MQNAHVVAYHRAKAKAAEGTRFTVYAGIGGAVVMQSIRGCNFDERDFHNAIAQIETRKAKAFRPIVIK
jgi:hypothetical protein